ncbi:MAG: hypothetical protein ACK4SY_07610 [Pyrobaculum sp.]
MSDKVTITVRIRRDLYERVVERLSEEGKTIDAVVEEALAQYDGEEILDRFYKALGLEKREYTDAEIIAERPTGLKAEDVVREIREERERRIVRR